MEEENSQSPRKLWTMTRGTQWTGDLEDTHHIPTTPSGFRPSLRGSSDGALLSGGGRLRIALPLRPTAGT